MVIGVSSPRNTAVKCITNVGKKTTPVYRHLAMNKAVEPEKYFDAKRLAETSQTVTPMQNKK